MTRDMEKRLAELDFSSIEARALAYYMDKNRIQISEVTDPAIIPEMRGWYICFVEEDGTCTDSVGPYESFEQAALILYKTRGE